MSQTKLTFEEDDIFSWEMGIFLIAIKFGIKEPFPFTFT
jgi:hypothetical protein